MTDVQVGAVAPAAPAAEVTPPVADTVPAPVAPTGQEPAETSVQPRTYTEDEHKELVAKSVNERLSKERRRLERIARAEAETAFYKRQLEERDRPSQTKADQPKGEPQPQDFEKPQDYVKALVKYEREQAEGAKQKETSEVSAQRERAESARRVLEACYRGADALGVDDFDEVVTSMPLSEPMARAISEGDIPAKVLYHLGQNHDEAKRIYNLPTVRQIVVAIHELETKLKAPPAKTQAPPPITPNSTKATLAKDYSTMTTEEHIAAWHARKR